MVCVAGEGQGVIEVWDLVRGGDEPQKKTLEVAQSIQVGHLIHVVSHSFEHKVNLMSVRRDHTLGDIGVDFASGTTYTMLITEWPSSPSEGDEQTMPCVDGDAPTVSLKVMDLTKGYFECSNFEIDSATRVIDLFQYVVSEFNHKPGTFRLQYERNKIELVDKDTRKLVEVGVDLSSRATVMIFVTETAESPSTDTGTKASTPSDDDATAMTPQTTEEFEDEDVEKKSSLDYDIVIRRNQRRVKRVTYQNTIYDGKGCKDNYEGNRRSKTSCEDTDGCRRVSKTNCEDTDGCRRTKTAYVGLVNQAMTCYLNSLLQALYMTPEFRNALYNWEYVDSSGKDEATSIPYQLQKLFLNLQTSSKNAIETTSLTKSFGWDSTQAWQQHDIQELCRVMFDALEQKFKNTEQADLINRLYEGKMIDYVKCLECGTEKSREDTFLDIPLPVRPFGSNVAYNSVEDALAAFVEPETLDGTNQYHCETCNKKCNAHKGLKFTKFPYLLTLHLKRFDFDYNTFHRIKLNDEVTFPDVLNLNSFISSTASQDSPCTEEDAGVGVKCDDSSTTDSGTLEDECAPCYNGTSVSDLLPNNDHDDDEGIDMSNGPSTSSCSIHNNDNEKNRGNRPGPKGPYEYELFSIMIHSGSASGGHYYAYIKDFKTGEWLCFNDQNVSTISYYDIQKTYGGGPTRAYYSGAYSSSTNAYMLMYRQIDPERNALPMQLVSFPKHLQELLTKMQDNEYNDMMNREMTMQMSRVEVFCNHPNIKAMVNIKLFCVHDETWADLTDRAYETLDLSTVVSRDQVRLVSYNESIGLILCSFEGREHESARNIHKYHSNLLMEIRKKDKVFQPYLSGGIATKVFVLDAGRKQVVKGPIHVRALKTQKVIEYKEELSHLIGIEAKDIILIARMPIRTMLICKNDSELGVYKFGTGVNTIFVPTGFDKDIPIEDTLSKLYEILKQMILLSVKLPDTSKEILWELNIPTLEEKAKENAEETPVTNGPTKLTLVNETPKVPDKTEVNETPMKSGDAEECPGFWTEPSSNPFVIQTEPEDWYTPEQSNSEDSSLSYSDRTLVGDTSEDDDYAYTIPLANADHEILNHTDQEYWDIKDPSEYYYKVTRDPDVPDKMLRLLVEKRMSLATFKKLLEPYIGVPMEYFRIFRPMDSDMECTCLMLQISMFRDKEELNVKLGRALRDDEFHVQLYQLLIDSEVEPFKFLCEWIVSKNATVGQTKKEILAELKRLFDIDIPFERCRLRRKYHKTATTVLLDDQKFKDIKSFAPVEIIIQELPGKEPVTDPNDVVLFIKQMPFSDVRNSEPIQELVVSGKSIAEVREKISEISGIPEDHLQIAKSKNTLPSDLVFLILNNCLDWNRFSAMPDNCPHGTLTSGTFIYYRDCRQKDVELSAVDVQDIKSKNNWRMLGISPASRCSPRRERALKIYVDDK